MQVLSLSLSGQGLQNSFLIHGVPRPWFLASSVAHLGGVICSFKGHCPYKCPHVLGGILRILTYFAVPDRTLQADKLAMLSNIGDISKDVHTYVLGG